VSIVTVDISKGVTDVYIMVWKKENKENIFGFVKKQFHSRDILNFNLKQVQTLTRLDCNQRAANYV